jgi:N-acetylglucosaminyldiphosphoundecaprenol N-acetyl-beta-D-mannosaminyltransferase
LIIEQAKTWTVPVQPALPEPVRVWGLPLTPLTFGQAVEAIDALIQAGKPSYFVTANLHYAMLTASDPRLAPINERAALILADGMPLVWASRWRRKRLPERVAGSDLLPALCGWAGRCGYRVFLLGGGPGIAEEAARRLIGQFPGLRVVGTAAPVLENLSIEERERLFADIRAAQPHLLFAALGQPKGELWLAEHLSALRVPVVAQIGASLDFLAGKVPRSPTWMQRSGLEWVYRLYREPRRLLFRYVCNALYALKMMARDAFTPKVRRR